MSGLEAVSLLLSILPLVISAAEHYQDIARPLKRYQEFGSKVESFQSLLSTQQTIYRNEVLMLLGNAFGKVEASAMAGDATHPAWTSLENERKLQAWLGNSWEACRDTIHAIEQVLFRMSDEARKLSAVVESDHKNLARLDKIAVRNFARKFIFSFSSSKLKEQIEELRTLNRDLRTLTDQVSRQTDSDHRAKYSTTISHCNREMRTFRLVQKAASALYQTLGEACIKHTEHRAHFSLDPEVNKEANLNVSFDLALRDSSSDLTTPVGYGIWLSVETFLLGEAPEHVILEKSGNLNLLPPFQTILTDTVKVVTVSCGGPKRSMSPQTSTDTKRRRKNVSFQIPQPLPFSSSLITVDLLKHPDLCTHILALFPQLNTAKRCCVGSLEKDATFKSFVYIAASNSCGSKRNATSLDKVLQALEKRRMDGRMSQGERVRFGRLLATAALQFHNTPWLKNGTWRCEDVVLFDYECGEKSNPNPFATPYIDVSVKGPNRPLARVSSLQQRPWIRNPVLIGLALLLLQLGFERPLNSMQLPVDRLHGDDLDAKFATAGRLAKVVSGEMEPRYGRLIDKCLHGYGPDDLQDEKRQNRYYQEVISELATIERTFKALDLDD